VLAVLAGALFLDRAQRLVPVYAAARDLPAGTRLRTGDLLVLRIRLPDTALRHELAVAAEFESDLKPQRLKLKPPSWLRKASGIGGVRSFGSDLEPYPDLASGRVKYRLVPTLLKLLP
jgi:hypothetical protein